MSRTEHFETGAGDGRRGQFSTQPGNYTMHFVDMGAHSQTCSDCGKPSFSQTINDVPAEQLGKVRDEWRELGHHATEGSHQNDCLDTPSCPADIRAGEEHSHHGLVMQAEASSYFAHRLHGVRARRRMQGLDPRTGQPT